MAEFLERKSHAKAQRRKEAMHTFECLYNLCAFAPLRETYVFVEID